jgi:omega-hydroxy-beta-dihydromenaquinone-9 sulfotransferase
MICYDGSMSMSGNLSVRDIFALAWRAFYYFMRAWLLHLKPDYSRGFVAAIRHGAWMLLMLPVGLMYLLIHWTAHLLDELFFRQYRKVELLSPVFIIGLPRSGTTTLHRALASDTATFSTLSAWEALFAPALIQKKIVRAIMVLDQKTGRPLARLLGYVDRAMSGGAFGRVHTLRLGDPEEDTILLTPAFACFALIAVFPHDKRLWKLARFDRACSEADRRRMMAFYKACLQKHMYGKPQGLRLLSKNAALVSWHTPLATHFPDAVFACCRRDLAQAVPSQISALTPVMDMFSFPKRNHVERRLTAMMRQFAHRADDAAHASDSPIINIAFEDICDNLDTVIHEIYAANHLAIPPAHEPVIRNWADQARKHQSKHRYKNNSAMAWLPVEGRT